jgi:hypothetical protein
VLAPAPSAVTAAWLLQTRWIVRAPVWLYRARVGTRRCEQVPPGAAPGMDSSIDPTSRSGRPRPGQPQMTLASSRMPSAICGGASLA